MPELDEALAHHALGQELRHHQRDVIGLGGVGLPCSTTGDSA